MLTHEEQLIAELPKVDVRRYAQKKVLRRLAEKADGPDVEAVVTTCEAALGFTRTDDRLTHGGWSVAAQSGADWDLASLAERGRDVGCVVVGLGGRSSGQYQRVLILPTDDPLDAVAAVGTAGPSFDVSTKSVLRFIGQLHGFAAFHLVGLAHDGLEVRFTEEPKAAVQLARRALRLCPELADEVSAAALARELRQSRRLAFWWD